MSETKEEWRGKVGGMDDDEVEAFLFPGWDEWGRGYFWVVPRQRSKWSRYLKADGRCAFTIDVPDTLEKVMGKGVAELVEEPNVGGQWVEVANRMAVRYLGPNGPSYLVPTLNQPRWLFKIKPTGLKTWQGVGWARSYWIEDTGGPSYEEAHGI